MERTNQFLRSIALDPTLYNADHITVDDTRRRIYVAATRYIGSFDVEIILLVYDADTETPITTISLARTFGGSASGLAANPVTGRVYISADGGVAIVDGNINVKIATVSSGGRGHRHQPKDQQDLHGRQQWLGRHKWRNR